MTRQMPPETTLLIADDHALIRIGLKAQLTHLGQFRVIEAWDIASLDACMRREPAIDLILLDLLMPGAEDERWVEDFCARHPTQRVLLVTGMPVAMVGPRFMKLPNVYGLIDKGRPPDELRKAVDLALAGHRLWPAATAPTFVPSSRPPTRATQLTERQHEVALLVARGMSNKQVADALGLSEGTVKNHVKDIFRLLGVTNRTQLALHVLAPATRPDPS